MTLKRLLSSHRFPKNGAQIAVYFVANIKGVPKDDRLLLELTDGKRKRRGWYMRPDEAVLIIQHLSTALHQSVVGYTVDVPTLDKKR
jgi:hypothetical protein